MKKTSLVIAVILSMSITGCGGSKNELTYRDFISNKAPTDNSKVDLGKDYLVDLDCYFNEDNRYKVGVNYEEYYSSIYNECIRLYEDSTFLYYSPFGAKSSSYHLKDNFFTVCFQIPNDENFSVDNFLFYIENDKILNLDMLSVSLSGFSFNGREFVHREKEQTIISQYLYTFNSEPTYTIYFHLKGTFFEDELLKKFHLERYKNYIDNFYNYNDKSTSVTFEMNDYSRFLDDIYCFYDLNKKYNFDFFVFEINIRLIQKRINIDYYSLLKDDALKDYRYYGFIDSFYVEEFKQLEDVDRVFTSKQELIDFATPMKDKEIGNYQDLKNLVNDVTDDAFVNHNLLMTRTVYNSTYVARQFDELYYSNNELHIVLIPASSTYFALKKVSYVFFIPKDLTYQSVNFYY